jgi:hypothetical protein
MIILRRNMFNLLALMKFTFDSDRKMLRCEELLSPPGAAPSDTFAQGACCAP